jgi:hypothetical protein
MRPARLPSVPPRGLLARAAARTAARARRAGPILPIVALAVLLAIPGRSRAAAAVEDGTIGWWIHAGSVRSPLLSRFAGPEGVTPDGIAIARAGRACGLAVRVDPPDAFDGTPVVFGPFLDRARLAAALACVRRSVPAAFVTQARPPR